MNEANMMTFAKYANNEIDYTFVSNIRLDKTDGKQILTISPDL